MMAIKDLAVSSGSACTSASLEPSMCCGRSASTKSSPTPRSASASAASNTVAEIDYAVDTICENVGKLRDMSPL